ncbi:hypothetical protein GCM10027594_35610 [Hymenobacter agri]
MPRKLFPLLVLAMLLSQCRWKKNDPQPAAPALPPITQNGSNTIGFRVDGQVWLPEGSLNIPSWKAYYANKIFWFTANKITSNDRYQFGIHVEPMQPNTAICDLAERNGVTCNFSTLTDSYRVTTSGAGTLHLSRLDTVQHIIAGTFEFEAVSATTSKTVHITDGRFDLRTD